MVTVAAAYDFTNHVEPGSNVPSAKVSSHCGGHYITWTSQRCGTVGLITEGVFTQGSLKGCLYKENCPNKMLMSLARHRQTETFACLVRSWQRSVLVC